MTRNIDNFLDAFREVPLQHSQLCIFRLFERIHQVHASSVWILPAQFYTEVSVEFQTLLNNLCSSVVSLSSVVKEVMPMGEPSHHRLFDFHAIVRWIRLMRKASAGGHIMMEDCASPGLVTMLVKIFGKQFSKEIIEPNFLDNVKEVYSAPLMMRLVK